MGRIKILDDNTINKIAAGEVVERPYSIVKELVENSIDALSTSITVEIKNGGKSYIRVTDNGIGMESEDMELAFLRHSTSKIHKVEDLQNIITLGFRGEALASIASVSQLEILSKSRESQTGRNLALYAGDIVEDSIIGTSNGTTIIVKNLFYNIPVRKKFLKTDLSESSSITDLVYRLSMSNPGISFKYIKDGNVILKTPGNSSMDDTMYTVFGKEFMKLTESVEKADSKKNISIKGRISKSTYSRGNRSKQYIFVNGRSIKSVEISKRIESIYKDLIAHNKFPIFVLFIDLDPKDIDINIHPSKTEIRFLNTTVLFDFIEAAIKESLFRETNVVSMDISEEKKKDEKENYKKEKKEELKPIQGLLNPKHLYSDGSQNSKNFKSKPTEYKNKSYNYDSDHKKEEFKRDDTIREDRLSLPELRLIGKVFKNYILAENSLDKELYIIDQHAAHERIMYEKLKEEVELEDVCTQEIISPEPIELSADEMDRVMDNMDLFKDLGFEIEEFGEKTIIIRGVPIILGKPSSSDFFLDVLDNLDDKTSKGYEFKLDKLMKLACTSAIKSGDSTDSIEDHKLMEDLEDCNTPFTCPHGRPTIMKLTKEEIEKKFKRT